MTDKELLEKAARRFLVIAEDANRITSGNLPHDLTCLKGFALRAAESIERNLQEPVSEELEEASKEYGIRQGAELRPFATKFFKAGAKWQKEQFEKNRLAACDKMTEEEAEIESNFCIGIIESENRQPTFDDAIKYGMRLQKEQMMSKAIVREVKVDAGGYPYIDATELYDYDKDMPLAKEGDKVKVIIIKED